MEGVSSYISFQCLLMTSHEKRFLFIKGPVYNLHLKISASKQHLPFQGTCYSISAEVISFRTWKTKISCYIVFKRNIYLLTLSLCATVPLTNLIKSVDTIPYCKNFNTESELSKCLTHRILSKQNFQVRSFLASVLKPYPWQEKSC